MSILGGCVELLSSLQTLNAEFPKFTWVEMNGGRFGGHFCQENFGTFMVDIFPPRIDSHWSFKAMCFLNASSDRSWKTLATGKGETLEAAIADFKNQLQGITEAFSLL